MRKRRHRKAWMKRDPKCTLCDSHGMIFGTRTDRWGNVRTAVAFCSCRKVVRAEHVVDGKAKAFKD